jgi:hypothetical protein
MRWAVKRQPRKLYISRSAQDTHVHQHYGGQLQHHTLVRLFDHPIRVFNRGCNAMDEQVPKRTAQLSIFPTACMLRPLTSLGSRPRFVLGSLFPDAASIARWCGSGSGACSATPVILQRLPDRGSGLPVEEGVANLANLGSPYASFAVYIF